MSEGTAAKAPEATPAAVMQEVSIPAPINLSAERERRSNPKLKAVSAEMQQQVAPVQAASAHLAPIDEPDHAAEISFPLRHEQLDAEGGEEGATLPSAVAVTSEQAPAVPTDPTGSYKNWTQEQAWLWLDTQAAYSEYRPRSYAGITYGVGLTIDQRRRDWQKQLEHVDQLTVRMFAHEWYCELHGEG